MNNLGLTQEALRQIVAVLEKYPEIKKAVVFGSRAKGSFKKYSDIDIAVFGGADKLNTGDIAYDLDELPLIYKFDVLHYEATANAEIKAHIDRVGVEIYIK